MVLMFLALLLIHALIPILGAVLTRSRSGVVFGGVVAAVIGLVSGTPVFMAAGVAGLLLGMWCGFAWIRRLDRSRKN